MEGFVYIFRFFPATAQEDGVKHIHVAKDWDDYQRVAQRAKREGLPFLIERYETIEDSWPPAMNLYVRFFF